MELQLANLYYFVIGAFFDKYSIIWYYILKQLVATQKVEYKFCSLYEMKRGYYGDFSSRFFFQSGRSDHFVPNVKIQISTTKILQMANWYEDPPYSYFHLLTRIKRTY